MLGQILLWGSMAAYLAARLYYVNRQRRRVRQERAKLLTENCSLSIELAEARHEIAKLKGQVYLVRASGSSLAAAGKPPSLGGLMTVPTLYELAGISLPARRSLEELRNEAQEAVEGLAGELEEEAPAT